MSPKRKIPTKAELIQLQKLYKTDEKIGERLGGVPAYLVAYWRRKKSVPKHSQPKFSENEVRNLWERFGDDDRCGLELGISKAAFYNWRRRYGIREKPAFLKLEQLELNLPGIDHRTQTSTLYGKQTITQKILSRAAGLEKVKVGELIVVEPDMVVVNQNVGDVIRTFKEIGSEYVWNPTKIIVGLIHGNGNDSSPMDNQLAREFIKHQKIDNFFDVQTGAYHQSAFEHGLIHPGQLVLGSDKFTTLYGALSAFATGIDTTEMASVWAGGRLWLKVPSTIRIDISGRRSRGVYAKDIVLAVIRQLGANRADYKAIEYYGQAITNMSISERITLCSMSIEMGAKAAICQFEAITRRYLNNRTTAVYQPIIADKDAVYEEMFQFNIDKLTPQIAGPDGIDIIRPVREIEGLRIHQVVVGTCSNGRFDDIKVLADILKGKKVNPGCRMVLVPSSQKVYLKALKKGLIRVLAEAGVIIYSTGCSPYMEGVQKFLAPGERCLLTSGTSIAYKHKLEGAEVYLCSPATAAASALNGQITNPEPYVR
jgi:3-isopropylmalate/(R)-2-methylmalate dehydratase large subunit